MKEEDGDDKNWKKPTETETETEEGLAMEHSRQAEQAGWSGLIPGFA